MRMFQDKRVDRFVRIKRIDENRQVVYGEVYAPFVVDTFGEMMLPEDIEIMAHRFMQQTHMQRAVDTEHDNHSNGSFPIESFIAREEDPDYTPGAWVLGVKVADRTIWGAVKRGELNGFSFQALVKKVPALVSIEVFRDNFGVTELGGEEEHSHFYYVEMDEMGKVVRGQTSDDNDHSHKIIGGTATEPANGHSHRYFIN